jgi:pimeloyl-ACP methyl ester carboxylesterase
MRVWARGVLAGLAALAVASSAAAAELWTTLPPMPTLPTGGIQGHLAENGAVMWYERFGAGPPVILLHGGLANSAYWGNQVRFLAKDHTVIVIDSRGHGRSTRDDRPYTYELMASDVVAVMDALKIEKAPVVGWSDGAIIGLVMAMKHPEHLTRVLAFAANMDPSGVKPDMLSTPTFGGFAKRGEAEYDAVSPTPGHYAEFEKAIEKMWDTEPNYTAADLGKIMVPVVIADGDHDEAIKREHTEYLARSIPGARLVILPGLSHFAMLQDPAAFDSTLQSFLSAQ